MDHLESHTQVREPTSRESVTTEALTIWRGRAYCCCLSEFLCRSLVFNFQYSTAQGNGVRTALRYKLVQRSHACIYRHRPYVRDWKPSCTSSYLYPTSQSTTLLKTWNGHCRLYYNWVSSARRNQELAEYVRGDIEVGATTPGQADGDNYSYHRDFGDNIK